MRRVVRALLPPEVDRRAILALSGGHFSSDLFQGAVLSTPVFLVSERGYSGGQIGGLLLLASLGSALVQPLFGVVADRARSGWMMPVGLLVAGAGFALAGVLDSFWLTAAVLLLGGFGVAAYHPEAIRFAANVSDAKPGAGMSVFALGGSLGFVLGPVITTPIMLTIGLSGTPIVGVLIATVGVVVFFQLRHLETFRHVLVDEHGSDAGRNDWARFGLVSTTAVLRATASIGAQFMVPLYVVASLGFSEGVGNAAVVTFFVGMMAGTVIGGQLVDRFGFERVIRISLLIAGPVSLLYPIGRLELVFVVSGLLGLLGGIYYYPLVFLGQRAIPGHQGLAAGVVLGMSIGIGSALMFPLGVLSDHAGATVALWAVVGVSSFSSIVGLLATARSGASRGHARVETAA